MIIHRHRINISYCSYKTIPGIIVLVISNFMLTCVKRRSHANSVYCYDNASWSFTQPIFATMVFLLFISDRHEWCLSLCVISHCLGNWSHGRSWRHSGRSSAHCLTYVVSYTTKRYQPHLSIKLDLSHPYLNSTEEAQRLRLITQNEYLGW